jgi:hypothetical protein
MSGISCVTSWRLAAVTVVASGTPPASVTKDRAHRCVVDDGVAPIDDAALAQLGEQRLVQLLEHAGLVPVAQASPADHATAAAHLRRQVFPAAAGLEHEQDAGETRPVVHRLGTPARVRR